MALSSYLQHLSHTKICTCRRHNGHFSDDTYKTLGLTRARLIHLETTDYTVFVALSVCYVDFDLLALAITQHLAVDVPRPSRVGACFCGAEKGHILCGVPQPTVSIDPSSNTLAPYEDHNAGTESFVQVVADNQDPTPIPARKAQH